MLQSGECQCFFPRRGCIALRKFWGGGVEVEKSMRVLNCASHKLGRAAGTAATRGGCASIAYARGHAQAAACGRAR